LKWLSEKGCRSKCRACYAICDAEIGEQQGSGFGLHRAAAVGMQGELAGGDIMLDDGVVEQGLNSVALSARDAPGDDLRLKIDDDIEIEVAPFRGPINLVMSQDKPDLAFARSSGF